MVRASIGANPSVLRVRWEYVDAVFAGTPELAGLKAVLAMQKFAGNPGVAVLSDLRTSTNAMLISLEQTPEGLLRQVARHVSESA